MPAAKSSRQRAFSRTMQWRALDAAHHIHPFTETRSLIEEGVRVITHGKGIYIWDSDGEKLIDGMAGLWCMQLGYGNKELLSWTRR
jgi:putrescine aminotransferase